MELNQKGNGNQFHISPRVVLRIPDIHGDLNHTVISISDSDPCSPCDMTFKDISKTLCSPKPGCIVNSSLKVNIPPRMAIRKVNLTGDEPACLKNTQTSGNSDCKQKNQATTGETNQTQTVDVSQNSSTLVCEKSNCTNEINTDEYKKDSSNLTTEKIDKFSFSTITDDDMSSFESEKERLSPPVDKKMENNMYFNEGSPITFYSMPSYGNSNCNMIPNNFSSKNISFRSELFRSTSPVGEAEMQSNLYPFGNILNTPPNPQFGHPWLQRNNDPIIPSSMSSIPNDIWYPPNVCAPVMPPPMCGINTPASNGACHYVPYPSSTAANQCSFGDPFSLAGTISHGRDLDNKIIYDVRQPEINRPFIPMQNSQRNLFERNSTGFGQIELSKRDNGQFYGNNHVNRVPDNFSGSLHKRVLTKRHQMRQSRERTDYDSSSEDDLWHKSQKSKRNPGNYRSFKEYKKRKRRHLVIRDLLEKETFKTPHNNGQFPRNPILAEERNFVPKVPCYHQEDIQNANHFGSGLIGIPQVPYVLSEEKLAQSHLPVCVDKNNTGKNQMEKFPLPENPFKPIGSNLLTTNMATGNSSCILKYSSPVMEQQRSIISLPVEQSVYSDIAASTLGLIPQIITDSSCLVNEQVANVLPYNLMLTDSINKQQTNSGTWVSQAQMGSIDQNTILPAIPVNTNISFPVNNLIAASNIIGTPFVNPITKPIAVTPASFSPIFTSQINQLSLPFILPVLQTTTTNDNDNANTGVPMLRIDNTGSLRLYTAPVSHNECSQNDNTELTMTKNINNVLPVEQNSVLSHCENEREKVMDTALLSKVSESHVDLKQSSEVISTSSNIKSASESLFMQKKIQTLKNTNISTLPKTKKNCVKRNKVSQRSTSMSAISSCQTEKEVATIKPIQKILPAVPDKDFKSLGVNERVPLKIKSYPIESLKIGKFQYGLDGIHKSKYAKLQILGNLQKLVYELELIKSPDDTELNKHPFMIIEIPIKLIANVRHLNKSSLIVEVNAMPEIYLGYRLYDNHRQCFKKRPAYYNRTKMVDITNGELRSSPYHEVQLTGDKASNVVLTLASIESRLGQLVRQPMTIDMDRKLWLSESLEQLKSLQPTGSCEHQINSTVSKSPVANAVRACSCSQGCQYSRCGCVIRTVLCTQLCKCHKTHHNCSNPMNLLAEMGLDVDRVRNDACFIANMWKVLSPKLYLNKSISYPCCGFKCSLINCIPGAIPCHGCGKYSYTYSWCLGELCNEEISPRRHCELCNKCAGQCQSHCQFCKVCHSEGSENCRARTSGKNVGATPRNPKALNFVDESQSQNNFNGQIISTSSNSDQVVPVVFSGYDNHGSNLNSTNKPSEMAVYSSVNSPAHSLVVECNRSLAAALQAISQSNNMSNPSNHLSTEQPLPLEGSRSSGTPLPSISLFNNYINTSVDTAGTGISPQVMFMNLNDNNSAQMWSGQSHVPTSTAYMQFPNREQVTAPSPLQLLEVNNNNTTSTIQSSLLRDPNQDPMYSSGHRVQGCNNVPGTLTTDDEFEIVDSQETDGSDNEDVPNMADLPSYSTENLDLGAPLYTSSPMSNKPGCSKSATAGKSVMK